MGDNGLYRTINSGSTFTKQAKVQKARLFSFGKSAPGRSNPTIFVFGTVDNMEGIFRSDDGGTTWFQLDNSQYQIGDDPNAIVGDMQKYGRVYIGTNGRGIFYGELNAVDNPGFEMGATAWQGWGNRSVNQEEANTGVFAGKVTVSGALEQWLNGLEKNTTYTLRGWGKVNKPGDTAYIGVKSYGGTDKNQAITSTDYKQVLFTFTTDLTHTFALIYGFKWSGAGGNAYFDDYEVIKN